MQIRGTVAGIYGIRRLQVKRSGRLGARAVLALDCCRVPGIRKQFHAKSVRRGALFNGVVPGKGGFQARVSGSPWGRARKGWFSGTVQTPFCTAVPKCPVKRWTPAEVWKGSVQLPNVFPMTHKSRHLGQARIQKRPRCIHYHHCGRKCQTPWAFITALKAKIGFSLQYQNLRARESPAVGCTPSAILM